MIRSTTCWLAALAAGLVLTPASRGDVAGGAVTGGTAQANGGVFIELFSPIGPVGNDTFQNDNLYAFNEAQDIVLAAPLQLNVPNIVLPAGTRISSHYVFFDPDQPSTQTGEVDFTQPVLGIITDLADLIASDYLGDPSATYLSPTLRGLEAGDSAFILGPQKIGVDWSASSPGDYIRVIAVPEPATWGLLAVGLAAVAAARRRAASRG